MYLCLSTDFAVEKCSLLHPVEKKKEFLLLSKSGSVEDVELDGRYNHCSITVSDIMTSATPIKKSMQLGAGLKFQRLSPLSSQ